MPPMSHVNHVTHLSPIGQVPQVSQLTSYTQLSGVKHLEPQIPAVGPTPSASYTTQAHTSYAPITSYHLPTVTPFEHVQTIIKPYHTSAVKHIEPQMNSIVPMHTISPVTTYNNPMSSATSYAQMSTVNPFEHFQTIVKPYPIYFKEEAHSPQYVVEQPSPPPPPPAMPSNFWHPDTLVYNKPAFTYHNSPGMHKLNRICLKQI